MSNPIESKHYQMTKEFMEAAGQTVPAFPTAPSLDDRILRARLIMEEALETVRKGLGLNVIVQVEDIPRGDKALFIESAWEDLSFPPEGDVDMVELADGCADLRVVTDGTLITCGLPDIPFMDEVCSNNLSKVTPTAVIRDGKIQKPEGYQPPNIERVYKKIAVDRTHEYIATLPDTDIDTIDIIIDNQGASYITVLETDSTISSDFNYTNQDEKA